MRKSSAKPIEQTPDGVGVHCLYSDLVDPASLKPNPKNPNRHPQRQIERLLKVIQQNGWRIPITVSTRSGFIVRGHGRQMAALAGGMKLCPVEYQNYESDELELADLLADNKVPELSAMDDASLLSILDDLTKADLIEASAFTEAEVRQFRANNTVKVIAENDYPELELKPQEHHDYIVFFFENHRDYLSAVTQFGITSVNVTRPGATCQRIGLGRCLPGSKLLDIIAAPVVKATRGGGEKKAGGRGAAK